MTTTRLSRHENQNDSDKNKISYTIEFDDGTSIPAVVYMTNYSGKSHFTIYGNQSIEDRLIISKALREAAKKLSNANSIHKDVLKYLTKKTDAEISSITDVILTNMPTSTPQVYIWFDWDCLNLYELAIALDTECITFRLDKELTEGTFPPYCYDSSYPRNGWIHRITYTLENVPQIVSKKDSMIPMVDTLNSLRISEEKKAELLFKFVTDDPDFDKNLKQATTVTTLRNTRDTLWSDFYGDMKVYKLTNGVIVIDDRWNMYAINTTDRGNLVFYQLSLWKLDRKLKGRLTTMLKRKKLDVQYITTHKKFIIVDDNVVTDALRVRLAQADPELALIL
jgi:hypothetical protein